MKKFIACLSTGLIMLVSGIYLSTYLSTKAVVIGTLLSVVGGLLMGGSTYFLIKLDKKQV